MKSEKSTLAVIATVMVLAFGQLNAKPPGPANPPHYQFEKFNFNLVISQQDDNYVERSPGVYISTIKKSKITNKTLLNFLASAFNTNWPVGAGLVWERHSSEVYVVDQTGTNLVFNLSAGVNIGGTNVVYFTLSANPNIFTGKEVSNNGENFQETAYGKIFGHLHSEQNGVTTTDFDFDGFDTAHFKITTAGSTVNDSASVSGDGTFQSGTWTEFTGGVTGAGKWGPPPAQPD